jgi:hypothetical protein
VSAPLPAAAGPGAFGGALMDRVMAESAAPTAAGESGADENEVLRLDVLSAKGISSRSVAHRLKAHLKEIGACIRDKGQGAASITATLLIDAKGRVTGISLKETPADDKPLTACLIEILKNVSFEAPSGKTGAEVVVVFRSKR